jgi:hypothetical protein
MRLRPKVIFGWAWPRPIAIWSAKLAYIARGLFSVFVANMEMECTEALRLAFKYKQVMGKQKTGRKINNPKVSILSR